MCVRVFVIDGRCLYVCLLLRDDVCTCVCYWRAMFVRGFVVDGRCLYVCLCWRAMCVRVFVLTGNVCTCVCCMRVCLYELGTVFKRSLWCQTQVTQTQVFVCNYDKIRTWSLFSYYLDFVICIFLLVVGIRKQNSCFFIRCIFFLTEANCCFPVQRTKMDELKGCCWLIGSCCLWLHYREIILSITVNRFCCLLVKDFSLHT